MKKILILLLTFLLLSCSKNKTSEKLVDVVGEYELSYIESDNDSAISKQEMEQLNNLGYHVTLGLYKDASGELNFFNERTFLKYDIKNKTIEANDQKISYDVDDEYLILYQENETLYFIKKTD